MEVIQNIYRSGHFQEISQVFYGIITMRFLKLCQFSEVQQNGLEMRKVTRNREIRVGLEAVINMNNQAGSKMCNNYLMSLFNIS